MRIVITGSKGFVGNLLVEKLAANKDIEIVEVDFVLGHDISNAETLNSVGEFDVMVHLAAKSFVPDSFINPQSFYQTNVMGTINVLELCRKYEAKMIFASSYVYGAPEYLPIDEKHPLKAFNPYAQSKLIGEELCRAYHRDFGINSIILRPFNIYGPGQPKHFLISSIIHQYKTGEIKLMDPKPRRDFVYVEDVVDAYMKAINIDIEGVDVVNIGSGVSTSIEEITSIVTQNSNSKVSFSGKKRKNEVLETIADISKAIKILQWEPYHDISSGIDRIMNSEA
jgi:nucleoside-diphosphate-sugar epimerase